MRREDRARRRWSLRTRITTATAAIVLAVTALGAVAFVASLRHMVVQSESEAAEQELDQVVADLDAGGSLAVRDREDVVVQVQRGGAVVASDGEDAARLPVEDGRVVRLDGDRYVLRADATADGREDVVVGRSLESADEAARSAATLLLVAVPGVGLLVAAMTWVVVGRALRAVERIRADVERIGEGPGSGVTARVAAPPGHDEVARLASTMNGMLDRLQRSADVQRQFVSDASHELRSPVAAIRQHAQVALLHPEAATLLGLAEDVDAEAARLEELVGGMLLLARVDEGRRAQRAEVDLDDLVLAEGRRLRTLGVVVDTAAVGPGRVLGDPALLTRAVRNAAENARRHAHGRVALGLRDDGTHVTLVVDDDGGGIAPADRERVFRRFERLDEARARDAGGSGLGLAIVAEAARSAGGTARFADSPLGGARLELRLPVAP